MLTRIVSISAVLVFSLPAANKKPVVAHSEDEVVAITATVLADKETLKEVLGSDLDGHYVVVDVKLAPKYGKQVTISRDDFLLRTDRDGDRSKPFSPSQIAGRGVLVISQTGGGGGIMGESGGPMWGGYPGMGPARMGGIGNGGGGDSQTQATVQSGAKGKPNPLLKVLQEKILPEKKTDQPVAGLLYFPMEKQKLKDLELIYTTSEGKISLRFR